MPNYRRNRIEGGTYVFALALADRRSDLLVREVAALRASVSRTRALYPFSIDAWVVLPEHLHAVWTLQQGDADFFRRDGPSSSAASHRELSRVKTAPPPGLPKESEGFGNGGFGNTRFEMRRIAVAVGHYPTDWGVERSYLEISANGLRDETTRKGWGAKEHPTLPLLSLLSLLFPLLKAIGRTAVGWQLCAILGRVLN